MRNVREIDHPAWQRLVGALAAFNSAHPWSHNDHFHSWILRNLPAQRRRALDIGCGRGLLLARLAAEFEEAVGTDIDASMRAAARTRCAHRSQVTVTAADLDELEGSYDLVTMVAVLHHLDEAEALRRVGELLAPGGRLLIVGLAPPVTALDHVWDLASAVANPIMGLAKHPRRAAEPVDPAPFPVRDPTMPVDQLRVLTRRLLPGATVRRRLFFRHTVLWDKPGGRSRPEHEVPDAPA